MRTLAESLFDKDIITNGLSFGEHYKPVEICVSRNMSQKIVNYFTLSKLKKDVTPTDMSGIKIDLTTNYNYNYNSSVKSTIEGVFKYILALVNRLPYKEGIDNPTYVDYVYNDEIRKLFAPYVRGGRLDCRSNLRIRFIRDIYRKLRLQFEVDNKPGANNSKLISVIFENI